MSNDPITVEDDDDYVQTNTSKRKDGFVSSTTTTKRKESMFFTQTPGQKYLTQDSKNTRPNQFIKIDDDDDFETPPSKSSKIAENDSVSIVRLSQPKNFARSDALSKKRIESMKAKPTKAAEKLKLNISSSFNEFPQAILMEAFENRTSILRSGNMTLGFQPKDGTTVLCVMDSKTPLRTMKLDSIHALQVPLI